MFEDLLRAHDDAIHSIAANKKKVIEIANIIIGTITAGNKVLIAGNGGSASDAQHLAAELIGRFVLERKSYPAICLNTDTSVMTAVGNDYGFEEIFARQIEGLAKENDLFIGISTSGNSENIIKAVKAAKQKNVKTICFLGRNGGKLKNLCDYYVNIEKDNTANIQEAHITMIHIICKYVEEGLVGKN